MEVLMPGKSSISMGHLYHGYVCHNQRLAMQPDQPGPFGPDMDDLAATAIVEKAAGHLLVALAAVFMERSGRARSESMEGSKEITNGHATGTD
jgi:hypothetical protein